jgi:PAS domain S-box-containing protein
MYPELQATLTRLRTLCQRALESSEPQVSPDAALKQIHDLLNELAPGPNNSSVPNGGRESGQNDAGQNDAGRKRHESRLRRSGERFRALADSAPVMMWMAGPDARCHFFNRSWLDFTGRATKRGGDKRMGEGVHPDDIEHYRDVCRSSFEARQEFKVEYRLRRFNGEYRWVVDNGIPQFFSGGEFAGFIGYCTDITDRRRVEEQLYEQAVLLDHAQDAIYVRDLDGLIIFWNKGAERTYGWTANEAIGRVAQDLLFKEEEILRFERAHARVIRDGEWAGELRQVTRHGKEIIADCRWALVRRAGGQPKSVLAINTDITGKKEIEAQFLRVQRVESIGTLASGIAHDINNVLSPILIAIEALRLKFTDEESQYILALLKMNTERGAELTRQVLSFASGAEGAQITLQLKYIIREIVEVLSETIPKSVSIKVYLQDDLWPVFGDASKLYQVLMNVCVNARDAMPEGGRITISAENEAAEGRPGQDSSGFIAVTVADTGTGIPPHLMDRIFEPFFTTKKPGKGTGLGLSTALRIVEDHNGFIKARSEAGRGTEFKLYLPASKVSGVAGQGHEDSEMPPGQGEFILIADDELAIRETTRRSLIAFGYRVLTASDGNEALRVYGKNRDKIRVVVMDLMMPGMGGVAAMNALRAMNPGIKIIPTSGLIQDCNKGELPAMNGVTAFLPKPYTMNKLLRVLADALKAE